MLPPKLFPVQPHNWSWAEIWLTELDLELSFSQFKLCFGEVTFDSY